MPGQNSIPSRMQLDTVGGIAKAVYRFDEAGGAVGNIPLELELPAGSIIHRAYLDVQQAVTSGGSATFGLNFVYGATPTVEATLVTTAVLATVGVDTTGVKQAPLINGSGAVASSTADLGTPIKLANKSILNLVVGVAALTAGRVVVYLEYFSS
ncbi:hypothetical protein CrLKS4_g21 [Cylindrospermopsis phage Cr-LKS4]|nr:hypothetical protein CrLKS4_g21 [Cylindrospermopsis phage Cr-LKS4]